MAAGEGEKGGSKVKLDEFTSRVVPDPKNPTDALLLVGFLGASSEAGQTRIYWDASLSSYVDVDHADILHTEALSKDQSPLGGAIIWVKRSAEVSVGSATGGRSAKGKFFEGPLMTAYGGAFAAAADPLQGQAAGVAALPGRPSALVCPSHYRWCTVACGGTLLCPIESAWCPVQAQVAGAAEIVFTRVGCTPLPVPHPSRGLPCVSPYYHCAFGIDPFPTAAGAAAAAAAPAIAGSYAPGCWHSWNACPTDVGCGPHPSIHFACPQVQAGMPAAQFIFPSAWCRSLWYPCQGSLGSCGHPCTM